MWAPSFRIFFYGRPLVALPMRDGFFVALNRSALRYLATPAARAKHFPHMARMIVNAEFSANQQSDTLERPKLVGKTARHCSRKQ